MFQVTRTSDVFREFSFISPISHHITCVLHCSVISYIIWDLASCDCSAFKVLLHVCVQPLKKYHDICWHASTGTGTVHYLKRICRPSIVVKHFISDINWCCMFYILYLSYCVKAWILYSRIVSSHPNSNTEMWQLQCLNICLFVFILIIIQHSEL